MVRSPLTALLLLLALASPAGAIVGGERATPSKYPWFADISFCGGALIAPDRVATAAHCVNGVPLRELTNIRLGGSVKRAARAIAIEPDYVRRALAGTDNRDAPLDDVAIVLLDRPVDGVAPLSIPVAGVRVGRDGLILGGGQKSVPAKAVGANFEPLRKGSLRTISDAACAAFYRRRGGKALRSAFRARSMVCAGDRDRRRPYRSACSGDSGGPLVTGSALVGIISWGLRCGGDLDPTVFTDTAAYRTFLTDPAPVTAPVATDAPATISGEPVVGATVTCASPAWAVAPDTITFVFDSYRFGKGRLKRQSGPKAEYVVQESDRGRIVSCSAVGSTRGGYETTKPSDALKVAG